MDAVDEVKQRLSIEDVVSEYVQLKRSGRNLKGLSPFGNEKTASFMVSPEKQIWHDFSSGKGGDMFTFIQEVEGLDFKGALDLLARKAGIDLEQFRGKSDGTNAKKKERLYEICELATRFYQTQLKNSRPSLEYLLNKRAFTKDTVLLFRLGYAPNTDDALIKFLKAKKYTEEEIKGAGLGTKRYRGFGDMFRGRIMVPLADPQGRVIGFTARLLLDDPNAPKYINTPQTLLYDKGRHVYGLHLAKEAIRKLTFAVVVEGNLDVIASHQAKVNNVVATAGTALTEANLKTTARFAPDVRFAFDSDKAGIAATERAIPIAQKLGVNMSIIDIPDGKDPDELVRKDPALWQKAINNHTYAVDWLIERYKNQLNIESGQGKRQFTDIVLQVIRGLSDSVEKDHYIGVLAKLIGVSPDAIRSKLEQKSSARQQRAKAVKSPEAETKATVEQRKNEQHFMALLLMQPSLRGDASLVTAEMFVGPMGRQLFEFLQANPTFAGDEKQAKGLKPVEEYVKITSLLFDELYRNLELVELRYEVTRLQERLIEAYVRNQKQKVHQTLEQAGDAEVRRLLGLDRDLNFLLKQAEELTRGKRRFNNTSTQG